MLFHPALASLSPEERRDFLSRSSGLQRLKKNTVLLQKGGVYRDYYFVASGIFRIEMSPGGDNELATVSFEKKYAILGETHVGPEYVSTVQATAVLEADVFVFPSRVLHDLMQRHPQVLMSLYSQKCEALMRQRRASARLITSSPEEAVGRALHELAVLIGEDGTRIMDKRVTQGVLASYLGLSREQVNKSIRVLEQQGLLAKRDEGYAIDDSFASTDLGKLE